MLTYDIMVQLFPPDLPRGHLQSRHNVAVSAHSPARREQRHLIGDVIRDGWLSFYGRLDAEPSELGRRCSSVTSGSTAGPDSATRLSAQPQSAAGSFPSAARRAAAWSYKAFDQQQQHLAAALYQSLNAPTL